MQMLWIDFELTPTLKNLEFHEVHDIITLVEISWPWKWDS